MTGTGLLLSEDGIREHFGELKTFILDQMGRDVPTPEVTDLPAGGSPEELAARRELAAARRAVGSGLDLACQLFLVFHIAVRILAAWQPPKS